MQEGLKELEVLLDPYDWFYEVEAEARRYVVYVTYMNSEQDVIIPDRVQGKQVVVHFAYSKSAKDYVADDRQTELLRRVASVQDGTAETLSLDEVTKDILKEACNLNVLGRKLDKLERECGPNILFDIFFEVHDGPNAVTNLGAKFPEVLSGMKELYNEYGFDPIYNELEG